MSENLENINPKLYKKLDDREITVEEQDEDVADEFDAREIFGKYANLKLLIFNQKYIELLIYFCSRIKCLKIKNLKNFRTFYN